MNAYQYVSKIDTQNIYTNIYLIPKRQNNVRPLFNKEDNTKNTKPSPS